MTTVTTIGANWATKNQRKTSVIAQGGFSITLDADAIGPTVSV